jgi:methylmalonyl-CoA mutase cobalamin-binding subunit
MPVSADPVRPQGSSLICLEARRCRISGRLSREPETRAHSLAAGASTNIISGLVEREILPKLRGIHRSHVQAASRDIHELTRHLLDNPDRFQTEVTRHAVGGIPWHVLAGEMLVPVAQNLGVMWEQDLCDFLQVAEAMGRLQSLLREAIGPQVGHGVGQPKGGILLAPAPGDTHTFGLCTVAGHFRDAGWATTIVGGTNPDPLPALLADLANGWYDVLGLSLACDVHSPALSQAMPAIRRASRNPALRVVVGGALVARGGAAPAMWGADACLTDPALLRFAQTAV